ncbi:MAG: SPFH domain-containing protein [Minisyncoccia bacterium]
MSHTSVEHNPTPIRPDPKLYIALWYCGIAIIVTIITASWLLWGTLFFGGNFDTGQTMLIVAALYLSISVKEERENEVGAAFCYGKALVELPSGLHFIPLWLMQIRTGPRTVKEFQCPGDPEIVQKTDDKEQLKEGMVRPIRVVTGGKKEDNTDILNARMTISLSFFVRWAITDVLTYASNYGSPDEIEKQVRDIGEAVLAEDAVKHTPSSFIDGLLTINNHLTEQVAGRFANAGIRIISTRLISPDVSHEVSMALADIPKARAAAEKAMILAEGEKVRRTKEGEGDAAAIKTKLFAEAEGRKEMMKKLGIDGHAVLASEAVKNINDKADVVVLGQGGIADAIGLVKAAQTILNPKKKEG